MAYLRREKENIEVDYPISLVWEAITKAITTLEWKAEETDIEKHIIKAKSKANFMAYPSEVTITVTAVSEKITRIVLSAETPVTTVTGIVDFGRTRERIDSFLLALVTYLKNQKTETATKES
jgi:hypothetical protein